MGKVIVENEKVLEVHFVCATAVKSQLFSYADLFYTKLQNFTKINLNIVYLFRFIWLLEVLQKLYKMNFRLISHEVNMVAGPDLDRDKLYTIMDVVFMKDDVWSSTNVVDR